MASHSQRPRGERLVIGITGRIGSGKTTVGKYLESRCGFQYLRYSEVLAEWRAKDPESKAQLQKVGWEVMAGGMQAELNSRLIARITPEPDVAVDGLRHLLDYTTLSNSFSASFRLLYMDSPRIQRFERLSKLGKYVDLGEFDAADSHPVEREIESLRATGAVVIPNERTLQDLYATVDDAIRNFRKEGQS
jgi:dephospho-CoA kinase